MYPEPVGGLLLVVLPSPLREALHTESIIENAGPRRVNRNLSINLS